MAGSQATKKVRPLGPKAVNQKTMVKPVRICCACLETFPRRAPWGKPEKPPYMLGLSPYMRRLKAQNRPLGTVNICEPCFQFMLFGDGRMNSEKTKRFFARFREVAAAGYYDLLPASQIRKLSMAANQ
jgi:hypothetical protein